MPTPLSDPASVQFELVADDNGASARYSPEQPRVPAGSAAGGQFGATDSAKPAPKDPPKSTMSYNPKTGRGPGYGVKGGDPNVRHLQAALNRLGLTDAKGKALTLDGKLGPKTTQAIMAAQQRLGLEVTGKVTPTFFKKLIAAKTLDDAKAKPAEPKRPRKRREQVDDAVRVVLDELGFRHPAKPPHEQWMHAGKAKVAAKKALAAAVSSVVTEVLTHPQPAKKATGKAKKAPSEKAATKRRVKAITAGVVGANRASVAKELTRQAELTPKTARSLGSVHLPTPTSEDGKAYAASKVSRAHAYYTPLGSHPTVYATPQAVEGGKPAIWISPEWHDDLGEGPRSENQRRAHQAGWNSPTGAENELASIVAHEYGHHVSRVFEGPPTLNGSADMPGEIGERFLPTLNEALGTRSESAMAYSGDLLTPVKWGFADDLHFAVPGDQLEQWVRQNRHIVAEKVSGYATENFREMLAEIWQEYSTKGDDARPHIKVIGDLMREIAEEST